MIDIKIEGITVPCYLVQSPFSKVKHFLNEYEENKDYYRCYVKNGLYYPKATNPRSKIAISALCPGLIKLCDHSKELHYLGELLCAIKEEFGIYDYDKDNSGELNVPDDFFTRHDERIRVYIKHIEDLSYKSLDKKMSKYLNENDKIKKLKRLILIDQILITFIQKEITDYDFNEYIGEYD